MIRECRAACGEDDVLVWQLYKCHDSAGFVTRMR